MKSLFQAVILFILLAIITGVIYPLFITGIARIFFSHKSQGSIIFKNGKLIGSELIAQKFTSNRYFWSRPSAVDYQTIPSGASNLGFTSKTLRNILNERRNFQIKTNQLPDNTTVPLDLLFASGSGLDPHITPEAAYFQVKRIIKSRNFNNSQQKELYKLVQNSIEYPQFGFLGESKINVFLLNMKLDELR